MCFLHATFLAANVTLTKIPFPIDEPASLAGLIAANDEGMLGRRIAFMLLGMVAAYSAAGPDFRRIRIRGAAGWLMLAFLIWCCASYSWTTDRDLAARKITVFLLLWLGALWAALRLDVRALLRFAFFSNMLTLATCLAVEVAVGRFTPWVAGYRFAGLYHPNETGQCLAVAVVAGGALAAAGAGAAYGVAAAIASLFLVTTGSRTSALTLLCAGTAYLLLTSMRQRSHARVLCVGLGLITVVTSVGIIVTGNGFAERVTSMAVLGRDDSDITTLTGRTPMWHEVIHRYIAARPLLGYGYQAFWDTQHVAAVALLQRGTVYYHSHSGYLEMALSIGVPGAAVHVCILLLSAALLARAYMRTGEGGYALGASLIMSMMVAMLTEPVNMSAYLMPTFLVMAFVMRCAFVPDAPPTADPQRSRRPVLVAGSYAHLVQRS